MDNDNHSAALVRARSLHLADAELLEAFESCSLPGDMFAHADHIRLAWIYVLRLGAKPAAEALAIAIRRFAESMAVGSKYHETITRCWAALVADGVARSTPSVSFEEFADANSGLFDKNALERHYSPARLGSEEARQRFLPPDRHPLP